MFCRFSALKELLGIITGGEMLNSRVTILEDSGVQTATKF